MINKNRVKELINDRIQELNCGLFVVDLSISPSNVITVELDKMGGNVSIQDCMSVSRNVEHNLNREEEDFEIQVSSAGLDKPFRVLDQYIKNIGRPVKSVTKEGLKTEGILVEATADKIILEVERLEKIEGKKKKEKIKECLTFQMSEIKETKVVVLFK
jgi:ribosome maturation factor RimP